MMKAVMSKDELVAEGYVEFDLNRLMHSEDAWKVGFFTEGGQFRFIVAKLDDFLQLRTKCRI